MIAKEAFVGFKEASITFPPTFKYDLLPISKHSKHRHPRLVATSHHKVLSGIQEGDQEASEPGTKGITPGEGVSPDDGDSVSVVSSARTSIHSRHTVEPDIAHELGSEVFYSTPNITTAGKSAGSLWISVAAKKLKNQWSARFPLSRRRMSTWKYQQKQSSHIAPSSTPASPLTCICTEAVEDQIERVSALELAGETSHVQVGLSAENQSSDLVGLTGEGQSTVDAPRKGVYDSSHKQRVPSWCVIQL